MPQHLIDLARSLGLLERIKVGDSQAAASGSTKQTFNFVIVIDFEATCWEKKDAKWKQPEIIEFPAILINTQTCQIISEFHQYVLPLESPQLSAFCTTFTGIQQATVDQGVPIQTCLMLFGKWLKEQVKTHHIILPKTSVNCPMGNTTFVTWSDWDLGVCLKNECDRKRLTKPAYFDQWIDLKSIFKKWYKYKPINFSDALKYVGMKFEGREHSGIDDSKNIARLVWKMVRDGATLCLTTDLKPFMIFNKPF